MINYSIKIDIKKKHHLSYTLGIAGISLFFIYIIILIISSLTFTENIDILFKLFILIIAITLILIVIASIFPLQTTGYIIINYNKIFIENNGKIIEFPFDEIKLVELKLHGYEMESVRNPIYYGIHNLVSISSGNNNEIIILNKDRFYITPFFLKNKSTEKYLIKILNAICNERNIDLIIKDDKIDVIDY